MVVAISQTIVSLDSHVSKLPIGTKNGRKLFPDRSKSAKIKLKNFCAQIFLVAKTEKKILLSSLILVAITLPLHDVY